MAGIPREALIIIRKDLIMGITVGIDIGGSTTKIVGFRGSEMLKPVQISSNNPVASIFGAFGKFLYDNELELSEVSQVNLSGVGASDVDRPIYGLPTFKVDEFTANGLGGSYFAEGKDNFMVVSMGTGTSYVGVKNGVPRHLGGIGIGGGTIIGLSKYILNTNEIDRIEEMAQQGDIRRIDLQVGDISKEQLPGLRPDTTAAASESPRPEHPRKIRPPASFTWCLRIFSRLQRLSQTE